MDRPPPVSLDVEDRIATITLNRAEALNALDHPTAVALQQAIEHVAAASGVRALVLRGEGRSFCGGGDVAAMHAHRADLPAFIARMIDSFHASVMALNRIAVPVVAGIHGAVAGGGISLALACDLVLAARGTRFVTAYAQLGAPADGGLSFRLVQRLGAARAFDRLTLHGAIDAEEALALGLVSRIVHAERADAEAQRCARAFAALPLQSVRELKELTAVQSRDGLQAQLAREKAAFLRCAATEDFAARVAAFAGRARRAATPPKDA